MSFELLLGQVETYDFDRGFGFVRSVDGREWLFHCTEIADGTRRIAVGQRVAFGVDSAGPGRWEARQLAAV
ncbi:MAG: cold shock domain-containing protein [Actinomycetota bacterium]|nr:cold shock domain-containing protein [Actinomycetota bacterium]